MPDPYQRPEIPYNSPNPGLPSNDRYQGVANNNQSPSGEQLDGDFNYIIDSMNALYLFAEGQAAGILFGADNPENVYKFPVTDGDNHISWTKITANYFSNNSVPAEALQAGSVTNRALSNGSITSEKLRDGDLKDSNFSDNTISFNKIKNENNQHFQQFWNSQEDDTLNLGPIIFESESLGGDLITLDSLPAAALINNSITNAQLAPVVKIPIGAMMDWTVPGNFPPPPGWVNGVGQNLNRITYAALFLAYGTYYGIGDGSTTFGIPDTRGRAMYGVDNGQAGAAATGGRIVGNAPLQSGSVGGSETVSLTGDQNGQHTHDYIKQENRYNTLSSGSAGNSVYQPNGTSQTSPSGAGAPHNNMSPYMLMSKIIYTGVV